MIKKVKLGDVCDLSIGFVGTVTTQYEDGGIPFLRTLNVKPYKIIDDDLKRITKDFHESQKKSQLREGDVVMVHTGVPGISCVIPKEYNNSNCIDMIVIKPNKDKINPNYLVAYMNTIGCKHIEKQQVGCIQKHFNLKDAIELEIYLPDVEVQNKIGELIKKINNKIENNNKINGELQSIIKTIYDYWFLQFEFPNEQGKPYKSSGGKMVWNEELKREIPEGWNVGNLYDVADFINGLACQKYRPISDNKLPVIKITEMHDGITGNTEWVRADIPEKNVINDGDILFSWSATLEVMIWNGGKCGLNQHIFKVVPKIYPKNYVFMQLSSYIINFVQIAEARKTTMGHITKDHLQQSKIVLPTISIAKKFNTIVESFFKKMTELSVENRELASLRDFLLPLLMNGQVGFKEDIKEKEIESIVKETI